MPGTSAAAARARALHLWPSFWRDPAGVFRRPLPSHPCAPLRFLQAGYFAFGGSTIVVLFQRGAAAWDADLLANSLQSLETRVLMGERLGQLGGGAAAAQTAPGTAEAAAATQ